MSDEEAFSCPFCGAPYRTLIPAGAVQVNCPFCKSIILVPPRLGGTVQRCPEHPDVLAVGLCNDCGKSYCDRCLYVRKARSATLYLCSECYRRRKEEEETRLVVLGLFYGVLIMMTALSLLSARRIGPDYAVWILIISFGVLLALVLAVRHAMRRQKPITVYAHACNARLEEQK